MKALRRLPGRHPVALAAAVYALLALVMFGRPVLDDLSHDCLCVGGSTDPGVFAWVLRWWPYAIGHGLDPLHPDIIFAPGGVSLGATDLAPGIGLAMAPVTLAFGPMVSYNLVAIAAPALNALFAFLLCRRVTRSFWPSLVGGYLFGFSAYVLGQLLGHMPLFVVFLVPAIVHLTLRAWDGELSRRRYGALLAAALVAQYLISVEVLAGLLLFGGLALALAALLGPPVARERVLWLLGPIAVGGAAAMVLVSPFLLAVLGGDRPLILESRAEKFSADALGFFVPTPIERLGRTSFAGVSGKFTAGFAESTAYMGIPLLAMVAAYALTRWRRWPARVLLGVLALAGLLSLGRKLHIAGTPTIRLPWAALDGLPVLGSLLPSRFIVFASLAASLAAALWLARPGRAWPRVLLALAAVATLVPNLGLHAWDSRASVPPFFRDGRLERALGKDATVLIVPMGIGGNGMLWQAESDMRFRFAGGYVGPPEAGDPYDDEPLYPTLMYAAPVPDPVPTLRSFIARHHVDAIVMSDPPPPTWPALLREAGLRPVSADGVLLYRVPRR